eukprot:2907514-Prymnesium_polylepis.2
MAGRAERICRRLRSHTSRAVEEGGVKRIYRRRRRCSRTSQSHCPRTRPPTPGEHRCHRHRRM